MADPERQAESAVEMLMTYDEDRLYSELGMRLRTVRRDPTKSAQFDLVPDTPLEELGVADDLRAFGRKFFDRVSTQAYALVCGSDSEQTEERGKLLQAFGIGRDAVAPALSVLLVGHLGLAPAIAAVVATLIVRLFFRPAHEAMCEVWQGRLPQTPSS
jgi:hypothetical protein